MVASEQAAAQSLSRLAGLFAGILGGEENARELASLVLSPPPGTIEDGEHEGASDGRLAILAGVIAARQIHRWGEELGKLLGFARGRVEELTPFDLGRLFHLRGFVAWRLEQSLYAAHHALNSSVGQLEALKTPEALAYLARVHNTYGQVLHQQGLLVDAMGEYEKALRYYEEEADEAGIALALGNVGRLCLDFGDFEAAALYLRRDLEIVERTTPEYTNLRAQLWSHLGTCALECEQLEEAHEGFRLSLELAEQGQSEIGQVFARLGLAKVALMRGEVEQAFGLSQEVEAVLGQMQLSGHVGHALAGLSKRLCGEVSDAKGATGRALEDYKQAREHFLQAPTISPVEHAHLLYGYARVLYKCGQEQHAAQMLREALSYLDSTAADAIRSKVEEELRLRSRDSWLLHSAGRFVGQKQIEFLLRETGRGGFRGEVRQMAVLFSDIRGFSALSERFSASELIVFLNDYLMHMTRCVELYGGLVDKFIGDALMAIFSLPEALPKDVEAAVEAALLMQVELLRFNRKLPEGTPHLKIGIGLHFGTSVAGLIGSPQKRSYTVIGDVVNTASRLEGMTKQLGARLLISEEVRKELPDPMRFVLRPLGSYVPKGQAKPVRVYDVMGLRGDEALSDAATHEYDTLERGLAAFAARDFAQAHTLFASLVHEHEQAYRAAGYRRLALEAKTLQHNTPPPSWNGAVILSSK